MLNRESTLIFFDEWIKIKTKNHEKIYTNHNIFNNIFTC